MIESAKFQRMVEQVSRAPLEEASPESVEQGEADRFREALESQSPGEDLPAERPLDAFPPTRRAETAGDAILGTLEKVRANYNMEMGKVSASLQEMDARKDFSPGELIKLQWEVFHAMFQLEVTTKVVDKSDQGVNTLLRSQG